MPCPDITNTTQRTMTDKKTIKETKISSPVTIMGHTFNNLQEIKDAVSISASKYEADSGRRITGKDLDPDKGPKDIHVAEIWQLYPCFDSSDRMYETRSFQNYFFSKEPFTFERLREIYNGCKTGMNFCLVNEDTPAEFLPAVYYVGERSLMTVATPDAAD